jgi:translation initiation factor IF-1
MLHHLRISSPSSENTWPKQTIETEGKITAVLAGTMFKVELANKHQCSPTSPQMRNASFV